VSSNVVLGDLGVVAGFSASVVAVGVTGFGLARRDEALLRLARRLAWVVAAGGLLAFIALERALITRDFGVAYVAEQGSSTTPALYNFAAAWSALDGSIVLWALVLGGFTVAMAWKFRSRDGDPMFGWALLTMFVVNAFFYGLMLGPTDPFVPFDAPMGFDGPGPNPLLQGNPLVAFHPPMLYLGYVGFTVPFAFAIAALVTGRLGEGWLVEIRRWSLFAWGFLTAGIVLGAWWAYDTLGWGGYWGWDPVENASFLPWLTSTAYLHSVMVQERRGMLRVWNLSLVCSTFALTILGTFLTRSGVIESVHAFSEGSVGPLLIGFFGAIVVVTVGLIAWRGDRLRSPGLIDSPLSREGSFLANNLVFAAFAFIVLLGTVFPLIAEAVNGDRLSVGAPYFERMTMPVGLLLLFLMAIAPVLPWRKASGELLRHRLVWPAWLGTAALVFAVAIGARGVAPLVAFGLGGFAAGAALRQLVLATRRHGLRGLFGRANGGMIVHLGVIMVAVALASSNAYLQQAEFSLAEGESVRFAGHDITFEGIRTTTFDERIEQAALLDLDGNVLTPAVNQYVLTGRAIGDPDTDTSFTRDIQVAISRLPSETGGNLVFRVTEQPLILWLWTGGAVMVVGTALALFPGRTRRRPTDPVSWVTGDGGTAEAAAAPVAGAEAPCEPVGAISRTDDAGTPAPAG
jgi:cytochrome c-type biogenesis protein CcmF